MAVHDYIKSGDFATEKHVPVIETVDTVKAGETFHVTLSVGKDIAHPNTVEHHIELPFEVGAIEFNVHGDGATANEGPVAAVSEGTLAVALKKSGKLIAVSYCNIHGLWESEKDIVVA
ncbi:MAG: class II SORL domain-containing protein [Veillonella sp.]|nr:class II SORL domain-containing protein [Veillonella sp.]